MKKMHENKIVNKILNLCIVLTMIFVNIPQAVLNAGNSVENTSASEEISFSDSEVIENEEDNKIELMEESSAVQIEENDSVNIDEEIEGNEETVLTESLTPYAITPRVGDLTEISITPPASNMNLLRYFNVKSGQNTRVSGVYPNTIQLLGKTGNQNAAIWAKEKIDLSLPFQSTSYLYWEGLGSDGITLTLHNDPSGINAIGSDGMGIGAYPFYPPWNSSVNSGVYTVGIKDGFSFEIDTYLNSLGVGNHGYDRGLTKNHMAFVETDKVDSSNGGKQTHYSVKYETPKVKEWVEFFFSWVPVGTNSGELTVMYGNQEFKTTIADVNAVFNTTNSDKTVYWGYTGATGASKAVVAIALMDLPQQPVVSANVSTVPVDRNGNMVSQLMPKQDYSYEIKLEEVGRGIFNGSVKNTLSGNIEYAGNPRIEFSNGTIQAIPASNVVLQGNTITFNNMPDLVANYYTVIFDAKVKVGTSGQNAENSVVASKGYLDFVANKSVVPINSNRPVITDTTPLVEVPLNAPMPNILANVSASDDVDGDITSSIIETGSANIDTSAKGVYKVSYNVKDTDNQSANTVVRTYVVGATGLGDTHALFAEDFIIKSSDVKNGAERNPQIISESNAYALKLSDGTVNGTVIVADADGYSNVVGTYYPTLKVSEDGNATGTIKVVVVPDNTISVGDTHYITGDDFALKEEEVTMNRLEGQVLDLSNTKSFRLSDHKEDGTVRVIDLGGYKNVKGTYYPTLRSSEDNKASGKIQATVVPNNVIAVGDTHYITANDFIIKEEEVDMNDLTGQVLTKSEAKAYRLDNHTEDGLVTVADLAGYTNVTGTYNPILVATNDATAIGTIKATVVPNNTITIGNTHYITANNFVLKEEEVDMNDLTGQVLTKSGAKAYRLDNHTEDGLVTVADLSGYTNVTGTYNPVLVATNDATTTGTIRAVVVPNNTIAVGDTHYITADDFIIKEEEVDMNDLAGQVVIKSGAKAYRLDDHTEDGLVTVVDLVGYTNATGTYNPVLVATNDVTATGTIKATVVPDNAIAIGDTHYITANNFLLKEEEVDVNDLSGQILTKSEAKVYRLDNHTEDGLVTVVDLAGYTNVTGTYNPVLVATNDATATGTIRAVVVPNNTIAVGDTHYITANNFLLKEEEVDMNDLTGQVIAESGAKAYRLDDHIEDGLVIVADLAGYTNITGTYNPVLVATNDVTAIGTIKATVVPDNTIAIGDTHYIAANDFIIKEEEVDMNDLTGQVLTKSEAKAYRLDNHTEDGLVTVADLAGYTNITGTYNPVLVATNDATATEMLKATVVPDNTIAVGDTHYITANNFLLKEEEVDMNDLSGQVIAESGAKAYRLDDHTEDGLVIVVDLDGYTNVTGIYNPVLVATNDATATETLKATVVPDNTIAIGDTHYITANNFVLKEEEVDMNDLSGQVLAETGAKAYKLDDHTEDGLVIVVDLDGYTNVTGTYNPVLVAANDATTTGTIRATVVPNNTIAIGGTHYIIANSFVLRDDHVDMGDLVGQVLAKSNAKALKLDDHTEDGLVTVTDLSGYENITGIYNPKLVATNDPSAIGTIKATVVSVGKPIIDPIYPGENPDVCGAGIVGNKIIVTFPNGSQMEVLVALDGTWCTVSPIELNPGEEVVAEQEEPNGIISDPAIEIVRPEKPEIDPIYPGENPNVCGIGAVGNTIVVTFPDGSQVEVVVALDGTWCTISPIELNPKDEVIAEQKDSNGNTSRPEIEVVTPEKPIIDPIYPGENPDICGAGTVGNTIIVTLPNGDKLEVTVGGDGTWCAESPIKLNPKDEVVAEQEDPNGNISEPESGIVTPEKPVIDPIYPGENPDVCGAGTVGNTIIVTFPDGSQIEVAVASDGTWCAESPIELTPGEEVIAEQKDPNGNISEPEIEVVTPEKPIINPIYPGENPNVCGAGTVGNTIIVTFPDGSQIEVTIGTDGTWCTESPIKLKTGEEVIAEQKDPNGNISEPEIGVVTPEKPIIKPIKPGENPDVCGEGTVGNTIIVTLPNGDKLEVIVGSDGTWCAESSIILFPGEEVIAEQKDPNGNISEPEIVIVSDFDVRITGNDFTVYVSEVRNNLSNLEQFVLKHANAKAIINETNEQIGVYADVQNLVAIIGTYEVELSTKSSDALASNTYSSYATNEEPEMKIAKKNIKVTVIADEALATTGENTIQVLFGGIMLIVMNLFVLVYRRYARK